MSEMQAFVLPYDTECGFIENGSLARARCPQWDDAAGLAAKIGILTVKCFVNIGPDFLGKNCNAHYHFCQAICHVRKSLNFLICHRSLHQWRAADNRTH